MKVKILLLIALLNFQFILHSQFSVSISSQKGNACIDSEIEFVAKASNGGVEVQDVTYTWSFGDNSQLQSGLNLNKITHKFKKGQGYIVRVDAKKGTDSDYYLKQVNIALKPNFDGTNSDRDKPICLGQHIFLTGKVNNSEWVFKTKKQNIEDKPKVLSGAKPYNTIYNYNIFKKTEKIIDGSKIDTIGVKLEHSDISHVKIELLAPNGTVLLLKDYGGASGKCFGVPNLEQAGEMGKTFYYYWTNIPTNGKMNDITPSGNSLPEGSYQSEENFNKLATCPLNGEWKIKITDNNNASSGYVAESKLVIKGEKFFNKWEYKNTYSDTRPEWLGSGVSSTSDVGLATATPKAHGNHRYTYKVKDDFGCPHDTSLINNVEAPTLATSPDSASGPFDLTIKFENKTSWSTSSVWSFGDRSIDSNEDSPEHTYTKDGKFRALLTAKTDDGCSDTVSVLVRVTIPESSLEDIPNAFTPNDDGINDVFKLNKGNAIKELEGFIYSRWGKKVKEWHSVEEAVEQGWDGKVNGGRKASPGVYFYVIKATGFDGKVYEKEGSLHLFR